MATSDSRGNGDHDLPSLPGLQVTTILSGMPTDSSCPPEFADVPIQELFDRIDAQWHLRATVAADESLAAGFRPRTTSATSATSATSPTSDTSASGSGFESDGILDTCVPSGSLAGLTDAATRDGRLAELDDDELIGVLRAWQRLESWCSAGQLSAVAELARRRPAAKTPPAAPGEFPAAISEFLVDEVAHALTLTGQAADSLFAVSLDLEVRLPVTARALHEGLLDQARARLIAETTRILSDEDAGRAEALMFPKATGQTTGQLRAALAKAILSVDPQAAARRREEAERPSGATLARRGWHRGVGWLQPAPR